jgi:hypothetical protein
MKPSVLLLTLHAAIDSVDDLKNAKKLATPLLNQLLTFGFGEAHLLFEYYDSEIGLPASIAGKIAPLLKRSRFGIPDTEKYEFHVLLNNPVEEPDCPFIRVPAAEFSENLAKGVYQEELQEDLFLAGISFSIDFRFSNNFLS